MPSYTSISENLDLKLIKTSSFTFGNLFPFQKQASANKHPFPPPKKIHQKPQIKNHHNNKQTNIQHKHATQTYKPTQSNKKIPLEQSLEKNILKVDLSFWAEKPLVFSLKNPQTSQLTHYCRSLQVYYFNIP